MTTTCQRCGQEFTAHRRSRQYCSDVCRKQAWRDRTEPPADAEAPQLHAVGPLPEAVATGPVEGLASLASWLAATIDGLDSHARAVHGASLARALQSVLQARVRLARAAPGAGGPGPPSRLEMMRAARASSDRRAGYAP